MRAPVIVLALVLAAPFGAANEAPVAIASASTLEATLFEPVVFTDASTDDGTIVSAGWTFTDGRIVYGSSVTRAFDYAGIHTIGLEVTDDLGATATTEIQILVRAPLLSGRAYALAAQGTTHADTGEVATTQHSETFASEGAVQNGGLRAAALDSEVLTFNHRAVARGVVGLVHVPVPIGFLHITGAEAEAVATCGDGNWRFAHIEKVRLNDAPIVPHGAPAPNTRVALPGGGELILNAQDGSGVTAVRILVPGQAPIEIAHAEASVAHCPYVG